MKPGYGAKKGYGARLETMLAAVHTGPAPATPPMLHQHPSMPDGLHLSLEIRAAFAFLGSLVRACGAHMDLMDGAYPDVGFVAEESCQAPQPTPF